MDFERFLFGINSNRIGSGGRSDIPGTRQRQGHGLLPEVHGHQYSRNCGRFVIILESATVFQLIIYLF